MHWEGDGEENCGLGESPFYRNINGKFINMPYLLIHLVGIFTHFRVDKFGIYLCGKDGFMSQHFLKGFQRYAFEDNQNSECRASDMRSNFDRAIAFFYR